MISGSCRRAHVHVHHSGRSRFYPALNSMWLFAAEGAMLQFTTATNNFGNNLFATGLGATDGQIGLVQTVPNTAALLLMLPLGMLSNRAKNSRTVPVYLLLAMALGYLLLSMSPMVPQARMLLFFAAIAFTIGGTVLYNGQWQNFFGDVVEQEQRNYVLTLRNGVMFFIGTAAPIVCGVLMGLQQEAVQKLRILQLFFLTCAVMALAQAMILTRIPVPQRLRQQDSRPVQELKDAVRVLSRDRRFLRFLLPVMVLHISWQMDWSMWYIGQVQYIGFTETQLSIFSGIFNIGQLAGVWLLSRVVRKKGVDFTIALAPLGLMMCPAVMILGTFLPASIRVTAFIILVTVLNMPQCTVNLCIVQMLLSNSPKECRTMAVTFYTMSVTFANCFVPFLGVKLYEALGGDYRALILFNSIEIALRFFSAVLLYRRYRKTA